MMMHKYKGYSGEEIFQAAVSVYGPVKTLFFDEIQHLNGWEKFIVRLHRRGYRIVVTGSNTYLLGQELASALTGRYIEHRVMPFSFEEYCTARNITLKDEQPGEADHALRAYLDSGGFPEPITAGIDSRSYVSTLFDAVLYKDIIARHRVRFPSQLSDVALFFASA